MQTSAYYPSSLPPSVRSSLTLMALNDVLCTFIVFPRLEFLWYRGPGSLGIVFVLPFLIVVLGLSMAFHSLCFAAERRSLRVRSRPLLRAAMYCLPALLLVLFRFYLSANPEPSPPNEINPSTSPSGRYVLRVSYVGNNWWIDVRDTQGPLSFSADTENSAYHGGYWIWDGENRLWFESGDTGRTSYWQVEGDIWRRHEFKWQTATKDSPIPPINLYKPRWQHEYRKNLQEWTQRQLDSQDKGEQDAR